MTRTSDSNAPALSSSPAAAPLSASAERPRVLIAEDHEDTRLMLRVYLERCGYDVVEATDGAEALRLNDDARADIILLDGSLPGLDGIGVVSRIRERKSSPRVPIIFLSGHAEPVARQAALDAGCDEYLTKPVVLDQLFGVLTRHLAGARAERRGTTSGAGLPV
jgi:CheY-like chemotaxis protein